MLAVVVTGLVGCGSTTREEVVEAPRAEASEVQASEVQASEAAPSDSPSEPIAHSPQPSEPPSEAPPATPPGACLEPVVRVEAAGRGGTLRAVLRNATAVPLSIQFRDQCPNGDAVFHGIEADVYSACNAGMCQPNRPPRQVVVPAGGEVEIAQATVDRRPPCQDRLRPGRYQVTFTLPRSTGTPLCPAVPATLVVR
jgi:hypothetical protein